MATSTTFTTNNTVTLYLKTLHYLMPNITFTLRK